MNRKEKMCPCGSGKEYQRCCGPILAQETTARTAEELMRSRYTANVEQHVEHLFASWHSTTRPKGMNIDYNRWSELQILDTVAGGPEDDTGEVEFRALYLQGELRGVLHERSRFCREDGQWSYLDGEILESSLTEPEKVGRNSPCPCGSGKKYKKCCLR